MNAVLLTDEELVQLQAMVQQQGSMQCIQVALAHPLPNLAKYHSDLAEVISRARDGSSYINEDFGDFLAVFEAWRSAYRRASIRSLRKL